jgi:hypothetical protein
VDVTGQEPGAPAVPGYLGVAPITPPYGLLCSGVRTVPAAASSIVTLLEPLTTPREGGSVPG